MSLPNTGKKHAYYKTLNTQCGIIFENNGEDPGA